MSDDQREDPDRRTFLKRAAIVAGIAVWTPPIIQSITTPAGAAVGSPPPLGGGGSEGPMAP